jgi:hypothetical protein
LNLHRLITNRGLIRRLRTASHIAIQYEHQEQGDRVHDSAPRQGSLHRDHAPIPKDRAVFGLTESSARIIPRTYSRRIHWKTFATGWIYNP